MTSYFIEECKERIALYSKLMLAFIGGLMVSGSGTANLLAMQSNPPLFGGKFGMLEGGLAFAVFCIAMSGYFLLLTVKQINRIQRAGK